MTAPRKEKRLARRVAKVYMARRQKSADTPALTHNPALRCLVEEYYRDHPEECGAYPREEDWGGRDPR